MDIINKNIKKILQKFIVGLLAATMITVVIFFKIPLKKINHQDTISISQLLETKALSISDIKNISKLEILEVDIQKEVQITKGEFFKKSQNIIFQAKGKYILDLASLQNENIIIDENRKTIIIFSSFPEIEISFDESKTAVKEMEKSWYTLGDMKLSAEDFERIKADTKREILNELRDGDTYDKAINDSSKTLEEVINKISKNNYTIKINYVK